MVEDRELYTWLHSPSLHKSCIGPLFVLDYTDVVRYYRYMETNFNPIQQAKVDAIIAACPVNCKILGLRQNLGHAFVDLTTDNGQAVCVQIDSKGRTSRAAIIPMS